VDLARQRLLLLRKWRATLERRTEQLYPELIRYADVVGATCIGVAASKYLSAIDFSVAIIDEAGQITAPNLLVPLVRAERAVLVGDHVQLPPYAESALVTWAQAEGPVLADLVAKSAFELLFPSVPESNRKMLNIQRRMPDAIGAFISNQFYGGRVRTETDRYDRDELFTSALAFIDTAELPDAERRERHPRHGEPWPERSWVNDVEAELIARLVAYYDARGSDWVVIVPFSAQEGRISALLGKRLGDEERAASRVASVDSFQGGEHDTVIFGFTRSNSKGAVGFFRDVRRSNVAFSRAKYRMIMVGDISTLVNASDAGFRSMMEALQDHVRRRGDLRRYRQVAELLRGEAGQ
jgi:superfamily I DNA and/or RNA helicase